MKTLTRTISAALLATLFVGVSGCATYRVTHVTDHDGKLYLTTNKKTTLLWIFPISDEQAITQCKATEGALNCTEVQVTIDGDTWDQ